jgi:hypothetical protein
MPVGELRPMYPSARPLGVIAVALAWFALGVGFGLVMKRALPGRRWLALVIGPGAFAALAYLAWVARSLV